MTSTDKAKIVERMAEEDNLLWLAEFPPEERDTILDETAHGLAEDYDVDTVNDILFAIIQRHKK